VITAPAKIHEFREGSNPWFEVTLTEGRNRQLRKMFEEIGHHVEKIRRVGYGPLVLDIPPGQCRELTAGEVVALERAAKGKHTETKKLRPKFAKVNNKPTKPKRKTR
jgi:23S rRNA pseudouridine2605 synthase